MGNKSKFCSSIFNEIDKVFPIKKGYTLFDPFTGTTNVSRFFKEKGINIICNDINDFSFVLGKTYIENCEFPQFEKLRLELKKSFKMFGSEEFSFKKKQLIKENGNTTDINKLNCNNAEPYLEVLTYLTYYANESGYPSTHNLFFDYYCENGLHSRYVNLVHQKTLIGIRNKSKDKVTVELINSFLEPPFDEKLIVELHEHLKNTGETVIYDKISKILLKGNLVGNRMFFSEKHGKRLDVIFNTVCHWKNIGLINEQEYYILIASLIETVTIFSNTSATYQAFYKDYRMNTMQDFRMVIPDIDTTKIKAKVLKTDAYKLIPEVNADIIYLDPPYNWRQYDSNYHLLNTIAKYNDLDNKEEFLENIIGASGENRAQKLEYTSFNCKSTFETLLLEQLVKVKCRCVALSYSDSESNHKREDIEKTIQQLEAFFGNKEIFSRYEVIKLKSRNFESRKGNTREDINELLFIAIKN